jgi:hypothetical protein
MPRTLFWRARRGDSTWWAVRDGDAKYWRHQKGDRIEEHLFDLANDPSESNDLLSAQSTKVEKLRSMLTRWEEEVKPRR